MEDKYLEIFVSKIREEFRDNLKRIILFGSRARGDNDSRSDYDLLLIFDKVTPDIKYAINELEGEMLYEHSLLFSAFPLTETDLSRKKFEPFIMNAKKEGVAL
ncbi:nucleotidyltransferase domain-containing protein [candidate division WOR-3 bacterium]|nr:nucleotidyltransferase domain-containing protein [candidate division WOR-3 bacterium]